MRKNAPRKLVAVVAVLLGAFLVACSSSEAPAGSCSDACAKGVAAHCMSGSTQAQCEQKCNAPMSLPGCDATYAGYADCFKKASSFTCDAKGVPTAVGCEAQLQATVTCVESQLADAGPSGD